MSGATEHLLRTLAAVPPRARVLALGCGDAATIQALALLGFDLHACDAEPALVEAARRHLAPLWGDETARRVVAARPEALGYPDDFFEWVVALGPYDDAPEGKALAERLAETRRVLRPGGWVFVALRTRGLPPEVGPDALTLIFEAAGFALAEAPVEEEEGGDRVFRGIYRKVEADTPR